MRKFLTGICVLMILSCCACGSVRDTDQNKAINDFYAAAPAFSAVCEVRMDHGDTVSDYVIDYRFADGTHTLTVQEPTLLNGLTVVVSGSEQTITYDGMVFAPKALLGTAVSPVRILCDLVPTWQQGYAEETGTDGETIVCAFSSVRTGEELYYRSRFAAETMLPEQTECFLNGYLIMTVRFSEAAVTEFLE